MRLEFVLPAARRLFLVVRGPAPSCAVVGTIPVRGRAGRNVIHFGGRVNGRALEPGVYLLTLSPSRRPLEGAPTEPVRVSSPRRVVPLGQPGDAPACSATAALASDATARLLAREADVEAAAPAASGSPSTDGAQISLAPESPLRPPLQPPAAGGAREALPSLPSENGNDTVETLVFFLVFAVVGGLLLTMLTLVTRFLRGSWSP